METKTICPVVNINGTSRKELFDQNLAAIKAVRVAADAVRAAMPNGRDFQTANAPNYQDAREQHIARCVKLAEIEKELEEILISLQK